MFDLGEYGIDVTTVHRNASPAALYQDALRTDSARRCPIAALYRTRFLGHTFTLRGMA